MSALSTIHKRPLATPTIEAIVEAAAAEGACAFAVHWRGTVCEMAIWQHGEWVGSVFRWPSGGLGTWCSIGGKAAPAPSPEGAVRRALGITENRRSPGGRKPLGGLSACAATNNAHPSADWPVAPPAHAEALVEAIDE